jgi:hypothetical protein
MQQLSFDFPFPDDHKIVFRAWITLKNGKRLYAQAIGKRAFPLLVKIK